MEELRARVDTIVRDPATAEALKPYYDQLCKRPCFHDEYLDTFNRPNVQLVDTEGKGVERITPTGVVKGQEYAVDCLLYASGFEVSSEYTRTSSTRSRSTPPTSSSGACSAAWRRMLREHPSLQAGDLDLDALERLPEGTLGRAYAHYIAKRYRETHDLLHVLTGYGTDVMGEMELQAYALGNLGIRTAMLILAVGTLGQLKGRQAGVASSEYLRRVRAAYHRGRASPQFLDFWFEHHWETPVTTLRARLCAPAQWMN